MRIGSEKINRGLVFFLKVFCICCILWEAEICYSKYRENIMEDQTTVVPINHIKLSFTLCKLGNPYDISGGVGLPIEGLIEFKIYEGELWKSFSNKSNFIFKFSAFFDCLTAYICKEFLLPTGTQKIQIIKEKSANLHLYLHQQGVLHQQEFVWYYPSKLFQSEANIDNLVEITAKNFHDDPSMKCSQRLTYDKCVRTSLVKYFKSTIGYSYPFER